MTTLVAIAPYLFAFAIMGIAPCLTAIAMLATMMPPRRRHDPYAEERVARAAAEARGFYPHGDV